MGSETQAQLPVIDFSNKQLKPGTSCWVSIGRQVRQALEEHGCFELVNTEFSKELHEAVIDSLDQLFDLPKETKQRQTSNIPHYGYVAPSTAAPLRETMGIVDVTNHDQVQSLTNLMWPTGNACFQESLFSFSKLVAELNEMITRMVIESYGAEKHLEPLIESTKYLLRMTKYRAPRKNEMDIGVLSHHDKSLISILHQNQVNGLQVQTKAGDWIEWKPSSTSFIVMAGYGFVVWSNRRIHCPVHRVIMKENDEARYSLAHFSYSWGTIKTPEEVVDEEHPLQFEPLNHLEKLYSYITKTSQIPTASIKPDFVY